MNNELIIPNDELRSKIYSIRGLQVMLDNDLAKLYRVETGRLNEQVKRNIKRFPIEFMFQLTESEFKILMSQSAISSWSFIETQNVNKNHICAQVKYSSSLCGFR